MVSLTGLPTSVRLAIRDGLAICGAVLIAFALVDLPLIPPAPLRSWLRAIVGPFTMERHYFLYLVAATIPTAIVGQCLLLASRAGLRWLLRRGDHAALSRALLIASIESTPFVVLAAVLLLVHAAAHLSPIGPRIVIPAISVLIAGVASALRFNPLPRRHNGVVRATLGAAACCTWLGAAFGPVHLKQSLGCRLMVSLDGVVIFCAATTLFVFYTLATRPVTHANQPDEGY